MGLFALSAGFPPENFGLFTLFLVKSRRIAPGNFGAYVSPCELFDNYSCSEPAMSCCWLPSSIEDCSYRITFLSTGSRESAAQAWAYLVRGTYTTALGSTCILYLQYFSQKAQCKPPMTLCHWLERTPKLNHTRFSCAQTKFKIKPITHGGVVDLQRGRPDFSRYLTLARGGPTL